MDDFYDFVAGILRVPVSELSPDTSYGSIPEWTSIMHLRLVMEIEDKYGVEIPLEQIATIRKLYDFESLIKGSEPQ
ncbi:MAG TPA: acyl carrier protein [Saccharofermentans sp.]|jgi:acyl carrier protein|nr:acyl carrier protein [Syntrophorhabdus sp.]HPM74600.1 acyl carrier protein [Saccharofermentans sp.]